MFGCGPERLETDATGMHGWLRISARVFSLIFAGFQTITQDAMTDPTGEHVLVKTALRKAEIVHFADRDTWIASHANRVTVRWKGQQKRFSLPETVPRRLAMPFRLLRRLLRLDNMNVVPVFRDSRLEALVAIRAGNVYRIAWDSGAVAHTLALRQCRNALHQSVCTSESGYLFFGEYGGNPARRAVPVYRSIDRGRSWHVIHEFPARSIRHVHGCHWDPHEKRVWICTGDFQNENYMVVADEQFDTIEQLGDGSQLWRTCYPFFQDDDVVWAMDSQLETSYVVRMKRSDRSVVKVQPLPGPVWYGKQFAEGLLCIATANEIGQGVKDSYAHMLVSRNGLDWSPVMKVKGDWLPKRYFKFGVLGFADGIQSSDHFYLFGQALRGMDGKAFRCSLQPRGEAHDD